MLDLSMHSLDLVLRERHHGSTLVGEATKERRIHLSTSLAELLRIVSPIKIAEG